MGFLTADLGRGRQQPHLSLMPSSDLQQLQQDATPEASGSNPYRCLLLSQTSVTFDEFEVITQTGEDSRQP